MTEEFCGAHRKFRSRDGRSPAAGKSSSVPLDTGGDTRQTLETWPAATLSLFCKAEIYQFELSGNLEKGLPRRSRDPLVEVRVRRIKKLRSAHAHSRVYRGLTNFRRPTLCL